VKKFRPRKGLKVRSAFNTEHVFLIDASVRGERLYHEKDSDRWWTRGELRPFRGTKGDLRPLSHGEVMRLRKTRVNAFKAAPAKQLKAPTTGLRIECIGCGKKFRPPRPWSKFHDKACHNAYWKKIRTAGKR
jgi:hypothetical protein